MHHLLWIDFASDPYQVLHPRKLIRKSYVFVIARANHSDSLTQNENWSVHQKKMLRNPISETNSPNARAETYLVEIIVQYALSETPEENALS